MSAWKTWVVTVANTAIANQNELGRIDRQQLSAILPNLPAEIFRQRAMACWSAASARGLVLQ